MCLNVRSLKEQNKWYFTCFFGQMVEFIFSALSDFEFFPHICCCSFTLYSEILHCTKQHH